MNLSHSKLRNERSGISIIEVLTSIIVALIGVFGVLVLIPFAVKQAQTGLESDMANNMALNSFARYEIEGYRYLVDEFPRWSNAAGFQINDADLDGDGRWRRDSRLCHRSPAGDLPNWVRRFSSNLSGIRSNSATRSWYTIAV